MSCLILQRFNLFGIVIYIIIYTLHLTFALTSLSVFIIIKGVVGAGTLFQYLQKNRLLHPIICDI